MAEETPFEEIRLRAERHKARIEREAAQGNDDDAVRIGDAVDPWENDERRYSLGLSNIDGPMKAMRPGGFTAVVGLTGGGKTSFLERIGQTNGTDSKYKVLFATLEMMPPEIEAKLIGRDMGVELEEYERQKRRKSDDYLASLAKMQELSMRLWHPQPGKHASARDLFKIAQRGNYDLMLIDNSKYLEGWEPGNAASKICAYISEESKATGIHSVLLAQLKQEVLMQRRRPTLADIEDTKRLSHEASTTILLWRPLAGTPRDIVVEIIVAKNRKGSMFTGHVHWNPVLSSYDSMSREEEALAPCCAKVPKAKEKQKRALRNTPTLAREPEPQTMNFDDHDDPEPEYDPAELDF